MEGLDEVRSRALHLDQVSRLVNIRTAISEISMFRPLFTELSPDIWNILSPTSQMEYER